MLLRRLLWKSSHTTRPSFDEAYMLPIPKQMLIHVGINLNYGRGKLQSLLPRLVYMYMTMQKAFVS